MDGLNDTIVPDSEARGLLAMLPAAFRPYASLARFDRPIGWWLLFWPGAWAVALAGGAIERWDLILWLLIGSIAMRGAGCVYNDIVDRDLDAKVERTRSRPLASGAVSLKAARSDERRVGKECVSTFSSRWSAFHYKKKYI